MPMTPQEAREDLVRSLLSGEYEQGQRALRVDDKFCCLGVACDRFMKITGQGSWDFSRAGDSGIPSFVVDHESSVGYMPKAVLEFYGFVNTHGRFYNEEDTSVYLSELNDGGVPFVEIADTVEQAPRGMFQ